VRPYPQDKPASARVAPRRFGRARTLAQLLLTRSFQALGGRAAYRARCLSRRRLVVRREDIRIPALPAPLEGFTLAHLTDLHAGPFLGRGDLDHVVEVVNESSPGAIVLTGDLITNRWTDALTVLDELARMRSRHGTFAVFGNHDYRGRLEGEIARAFGARGIRFLRNECVRLGEGGAHLALVGVEDVEEARVVDLDAARAGLHLGDVEIVLCHNPVSAPIFASMGAHAVLSGHTHGTQIDLPGLRRMGPQHPGLRVEFGATTLIVNRGLGVTTLPFRIGAPAEIVLVRLFGSAT
jgi:predicted MPP superfamily phosphohydrolase